MARAAPAPCGTCGFFLPLAGSLRAAFGVCGNEYAPGRRRRWSRSGSAAARTPTCSSSRSSPVAVAELVYDDGVDLEPVGVRDADVADPFGTAALRAAVLAAWAASPTRFREDANAEEDLRLGGYADAWFVELAQNAADAARAGGRARPAARSTALRSDGELRVANTGAPLDAAGVAALAVAARVGQAGRRRLGRPVRGRVRRGAPAVRRARGCVRTRRRGGVLRRAHRRAPSPRCPARPPSWPAATSRRCCGWSGRRGRTSAPPAGFDTEVRLPLRAGRRRPPRCSPRPAPAAADLLLALPDLVEIDVGRAASVAPRRRARPRRGDDRRAALAAGPPGRGARRGRRRGAGRRAARPARLVGVLGAAADRRRRARPARRRRAARPDGHRRAARRCPARLIATVPLEPDRRRVRPGPATDAVLAARGRGLPRPGAGRPRRSSGWRWCPSPASRAPSWTGGCASCCSTPCAAPRWLPGARPAARAGPGRRGVAGPARRGPAAAARAAAEAGFDRLLGRRPGAGAALAELGVHRLTAAELVDRLLGVERPPAGGGRCTRRWRRSPRPCPGCSTSCARCPSRWPTAARRPARPRVLLPRPPDGAESARRRTRLAALGPARAAHRAPRRRAPAARPARRRRRRPGGAAGAPGAGRRPSSGRWTTPRPGWTRRRWPRRCWRWSPSPAAPPPARPRRARPARRRRPTRPAPTS